MAALRLIDIAFLKRKLRVLFYNGRANFTPQEEAAGMRSCRRIKAINTRRIIQFSRYLQPRGLTFGAVSLAVII